MKERALFSLILTHHYDIYIAIEESKTSLEWSKDMHCSLWPKLDDCFSDVFEC